MVADTVLLEAARKVMGEFSLSKEWLTAGSVGAALATEAGNVYTGICLDLACGIGFCAEHSAIAEMLKNRETVIRKIVAVSADRILPPCGRCRELIQQIDARNFECVVLLPEGNQMLLRELLPYTWMR